MELIGEPMNSNGAKSARIVLSQEESAWLFNQVGVGMPAGVSMTLEEGREAVRPLLLDAAQRALIARGLVFFDAENDLQIDRGLLAIASIVTNPNQVAVLVKQEGLNPPEQYYFYRVPEMVVAYNLSMPGLYEFDVTTNVDMGKSLVNGWLSDHSDRLRESPIYTIAKDDLLKAQQSASESQEQAVSHLVSVGVSGDDALSFAQAIAEPSFSLILQMIYQPGFQSEQRLFILTTGLDGHWLVDSDGRQSEMIRLRCLTDEQLRLRVDEAYRDLLVPLATTDSQDGA